MAAFLDLRHGIRRAAGQADPTEDAQIRQVIPHMGHLIQCQAILRTEPFEDAPFVRDPDMAIGHAELAGSRLRRGTGQPRNEGHGNPTALEKDDPSPIANMKGLRRVPFGSETQSPIREDPIHVRTDETNLPRTVQEIGIHGPSVP